MFYEAPARLRRLLTDLAAHCGAHRRVAVARELTKLHETFVRGTLAEAVAYYSVEPVRGEVVVVLDGRAAGAPVGGPEAVELARSMLDGGERPSAVARALARRFGIARNEAYAIALTQAGERKDD